MALGSGEPFGVATIAFCHTVRVAPDEEVRISTRERYRVKGLKRGSRPLVMPLLFEAVLPIDECCEDLDEHMVAAKTERRRLCGHSRDGALELVGEDGATWRDGRLHRLDENIDAADVERRNPAGFHENTLAVHDIRIEQAQRRPIGCRVHSAGEHRSKPEKRRDSSFAFLWRAAPGRHDHDEGFAVRAADAPDLERQIVGRGSGNVGAPSEDTSSLGEWVNQHARADAGQIV
jgi:hypothetical protein